MSDTERPGGEAPGIVPTSLAEPDQTRPKAPVGRRPASRGPSPASARERPGGGASPKAGGGAPGIYQVGRRVWPD